MSHVAFSYGRDAAPALANIDLAVDEGEFVGVIGPSGAGKSTLASLMSGAIPHHRTGRLTGSCRVDGVDTCTVTLTDISRSVGSVLQDIDAQMVAAGVEDELLFGLENFGVAHDEIEGRLAAALDEVGIAELRHREIATLSGGQQQKVAIAAILALRPRVLVLDEPTASLDPLSARVVFETLRAVSERVGASVVVIEQNVALLSAFCRRIIVLDHGRIALAGAPGEVFAHSRELRRIGVDSPRTARISNSLAAAELTPAGPPALDVAAARALIVGALGARAMEPLPAAAVRRGATCVSRAHGTTPADPILSFHKVGYTYARTGAFVRDLTFEVRPGEIVGIAGHNGAGKTTLIKLLNGLLRPRSGCVRLAGLDTAKLAVSEIAGRVATLFQNPDRQICRRTVLEEIAFGLELQQVASTEARERARAVIERFGLRPEATPFSLSRGTRRLVALASVVVMDPAVVVLDEPTSGLDYRECMTVMETVRGMARRGAAVILVCHDMEVVSDFADRLIVMADGEIVATGPTGAVFADRAALARAGITPPQVTELSQSLVADGATAFSGVSEVRDIVAVVKELMDHA